MKHIFQQKHDPENGQHGDCHRCCIAMILGLDKEDVPHFYDVGIDTEEANKNIEQFFNDRGLTQFDLILPKHYGLNDVLDYTRCISNVTMILGCWSSNNTNHSVVIKGDTITNPSESSQIVGPMRGAGCKIGWHLTVITLKVD